MIPSIKQAPDELFVYVASVAFVNNSAAAHVNEVGSPVGKVTVGAEEGKTLIVCEFVIVFPQASDNDQVLIKLYPQLLGVPVSPTNVTVGFAVQLSEPFITTDPTNGTASQFTVISAGKLLNIGLILSPLDIDSVTVVWLLHASVIEYVRVITSGQVPVDVSVNVTTKLASAVQLSAMVIPKPSSPATVV
jgi:hypothetical protein